MAKAARPPGTPSRVKKTPDPSGIASVDALASLQHTTLTDYLKAVSEYVRAEGALSAEQKKRAQIRLSIGLAKALLSELKRLQPEIDGYAGERAVAGALRTVQADVSEFHELDGLRLAVEIKPINLAVGRAIWNRFGDIRAFAVNLHLKFPFAVVGGVLVIPTYEIAKRKPPKGSPEGTPPTLVKKPTGILIERTIGRLIRAGGRRNDSEAPHLLEAIAVVVYDPDTGELDVTMPSRKSGLRWDQFIQALALAYDNRFGEGVGSSVAEAEAEAEENEEAEDSGDDET